MNESAQQLQEQLGSAESDEEKIQLLHRLSYELHREDPGQTLHFAKESLRLAASIKDRKAEAESYRYIGLANMFLSRYGAAQLNFRKGLRLFEAVGDELGKAHVLSNIGSLSYNTGEYREALEVLHEALEIGERHSDPRVINKVLTNLGVIYGVLGDYQRAIDYHYRSMKIKEELGMRETMDLTNIGSIYFEMRDFPKALEYFQRCLEVHQDGGDKSSRANAILNIGTTYQEMGEQAEAYRRWIDALEIFREMGDKGNAAFVMQLLGKHHRVQEEFDLASRYIDGARRIALEIKSEPLLLESLFAEGGIQQARGNYPEAINLLNRALEKACETGVREAECEAHRYLAEIHELAGSIPQAFYHHRQYVAINQEMLSLEKQKAINEMEIRASVERAEKEREILRLNNERLEMEMELKTKELTTLAMQLVQKNEFLDTLNQQVQDLIREQGQGNGKDLAILQRQIDQGRNSESEWETFEQQFRSIHPGFIEQLAREHQTLSPAELKVCALLKLKMSTKDVASMLCCSSRTVEDHRYRIRTKLGLGKEINLSAYLAGV